MAKFEANRPSGPIVKVLPLRSGPGALMAVVTDPNYAEVIEPGVLEFTVSAPLELDPDGVFLLEGGTAHFRLLENGVNAEGKESVSGKKRSIFSRDA